jgi:uncharacterized damage-inducible protein DinB
VIESAEAVNPRPAIMFVAGEADPRNHIPRRADERTTLLEQLQWERQTIELKCVDLTPEQLADRAVPPSTMSLLGIVRHLAEVERRWFRRWMAGQDVPPHFYGPESPEGDFDGAVADPEVVAKSFQLWREEAAFADQFTRDAPDLDIVGTIEFQGSVTLREVLIHVIQEHARHAGHADLLREVIDGRIGI